MGGGWVSYPVQRATEAVYGEEGKIQVRELIDYYLVLYFFGPPQY